MKRVLVAVLATISLVSLTGLNGCKTYDVEIVVPPGAESMDEALVVIVDTHTGDKVVVPYPTYLEMQLNQYHSVAEVEALRKGVTPEQRRVRL
jgi:hypothetical protein